LSQELKDAVKRPLGGAGLANGATVFGLGGTGKTQLVLRYIETHKALYESVLWLDVHSQETTKSSFERCCRQLGLPVDRRTEAQILQDSIPVRTVLRWLNSRKEGQEWLVVIDNADDLTWDLHAIIPKGCVGTVIITSNDRAASTLLDGKSDIVHVDAMTNGESLTLLLKVIEVENAITADDTRVLLENTIERLDKLPLAIDVAGRRIRTVASIPQGDNGLVGEEHLNNALQRFLDDLKLHGSKLLRDTAINWTPSYRKTIWTVWESSFASLRKFPHYHPEHLLSLMAQLNGITTETELFRQASFDLHTVCGRLGVEAPPWLAETLKMKDNDVWDDFVYREAVNVLQRYGLVRQIHKPDPGVTMHRLVKLRAAEGASSKEEWTWFLAFIVAVCHRSLLFYPRPDRRHIRASLPTAKVLTEKKTCLSSEGLIWAWLVMATFFEEEGESEACEHLREAILSLRESSLGLKHPKTQLSKVQLTKLRKRRFQPTTSRTYGTIVEQGADGSSLTRPSEPFDFEYPLKRGPDPKPDYARKDPASTPDRRKAPNRFDDDVVRDLFQSYGLVKPEPDYSNPLEFLRTNTALGFKQMREDVRQQPALLEPYLHRLGCNNIALASNIHNNYEFFLQMLIEDD
jgi:hypothetical protein